MHRGYKAGVMVLVGTLLYVFAGFIYQEHEPDQWTVSEEPTVEIPVKEGHEVFTDPLGFIWVRPPVRAQRVVETVRGLALWRVFDSTGRKVTEVTLPLNFKIQTIGETYVLGTWKSEAGDEYVRMYSLDRGN